MDLKTAAQAALNALEHLTYRSGDRLFAGIIGDSDVTDRVMPALNALRAIVPLAASPATAGCACDPKGLDSERCPGANGKLLCESPAAATPVAAEPRLSAEARVGGTVFGVGVPERLVIEAAKRAAVQPQGLISEEAGRELRQMIADNAGRAAFLESHPAVSEELARLIEENERLREAAAPAAEPAGVPEVPEPTDEMLANWLDSYNNDRPILGDWVAFNGVARDIYEHAHAAGREQERAELESYRQTLEVIGLNDSKDPQRDATQTLIDSGFWRVPPPAQPSAMPDAGVREQFEAWVRTSAKFVPNWLSTTNGEYVDRSINWQWLAYQAGRQQGMEQARAAAASVAWQPIATAPKASGGLVDIFTNRRYADCHWDAICREYRHIDHSGTLIRLRNARFWMPSPPAPQEGSEGND